MYNGSFEVISMAQGGVTWWLEGKKLLFYSLVCNLLIRRVGESGGYIIVKRVRGANRGYIEKERG